MEAVHVKYADGNWVSVFLEETDIYTFRPGCDSDEVFVSKASGKSPRLAAERFKLLSECLSDGGRVAEPPAPLEHLKSSPPIAAQLQYNTVASCGGITQKQIDEAYALTKTVFDVLPENVRVTLELSQCSKSGVVYFGEHGISGMSHKFGIVPEAIWDGYHTEAQEAIISSGQGVDGYLTPEGCGAVMYRGYKRMVELLWRVFLASLLTNDKVYGMDSNDKAFMVPSQLFESEFSDFEWYPVYQSVVEGVLVDEGIITGDPNKAFSQSGGAVINWGW